MGKPPVTAGLIINFFLNVTRHLFKLVLIKRLPLLDLYTLGSFSCAGEVSFNRHFVSDGAILDTKTSTV